MAEAQPPALPAATRRTASFMTHPVFSSHQSEHQMLRYIFKLAQRDISLVHCMIPLGSCTMKLNATAEMMPITWPELNRIHPFAPAEQTQVNPNPTQVNPNPTQVNPNPNPNAGLRRADHLVRGHPVRDHRLPGHVAPGAGSDQG